MPKPKSNPVVMMRMLVDGALRAIDNDQLSQPISDIYFLNIFRMFEVIKYDADFRDYRLIVKVFDSVRPQNLSRSDFVDLGKSACCCLGANPAIAMNETEYKIFAQFLRDFSVGLRENEGDGYIFEGGLYDNIN